MREYLRATLAAVAILGLFVAASCTSSAGPSPAASSAKPAASSEASAKPAGSAAPSTQAAASEAWKVEWDKTVAAAKKEGKVVVAGYTGDLYRNAIMAFQKAYPDIKLEFTGVTGGDYSPRILAEREAGQYLWDAHSGGGTSMLTALKPKGVLDNLRAALVLPEILDDKVWVGGFDDPWMDKDRQNIFMFEGNLTYRGFVNRDVASASELGTFDQLLDPKWKGKIASGDPRLPGGANGVGGHLLWVKGEDWLRKFYAQDIVILKDERQLAEGLVRGRYAAIVGINPASLEQFRQEGLMKSVEPLEPASEAAVSLTSALGNLSLISKAPNPNAAKVFVNWLLSKEGQTAYVQTMNVNSRRLDVQGPPESAPKPGVVYRDLNKEENASYKTRVMEIAKEYFQ